MNSYLRNECDKTLFAHERIIFGTSDEGASASFAPMCLILLLASIFYEMNIMSDLSYTLCNRMALVHTIAIVSIELIAIYFHFFRNFHHPNWRNGVL
jgi:hypothetical protein